MLNKKQMYKRQEVSDILTDIMVECNVKPIAEQFEGWLNDRGLNGNNGANEHLFPEFVSDMIDVILDD